MKLANQEKTRASKPAEVWNGHLRKTQGAVMQGEVIGSFTARENHAARNLTSLRKKNPQRRRNESESAQHDAPGQRNALRARIAGPSGSYKLVRVYGSRWSP